MCFGVSLGSGGGRRARGLCGRAVFTRAGKPGFDPVELVNALHLTGTCRTSASRRDQRGPGGPERTLFRRFSYGITPLAVRRCETLQGQRRWRYGLPCARMAVTVRLC